ncbi:I78 family peptidase inhibitor [Lysobacter sp. F60174L2]|uniref:I78 family peptidase inhibitor n=1 Tax=Lysobacter sp. F60174L2 TaxID=3459295 RepID=UPI00403DD4D9
MLITLVFSALGCAGTDATETAEGHCNAAPAGWAIGGTADQRTMGQIWRASGAGLIRPVSSGQAVLHDRRPDRLTVEIDKANRIVAVRCE